MPTAHSTSSRTRVARGDGDATSPPIAGAARLEARHADGLASSHRKH
jgi:hypothetical protein